MQGEPIYKYMTVSPLTIGRSEPLLHAKKAMAENSIRHLPVLDGGAVVGIVSERDVEIVLAANSVGKVEDAMTKEPYIVSADAKLVRVATEMAQHKYGCAIVLERGTVAGVFTTVDALHVLAKMLEAETAPTSAH